MFIATVEDCNNFGACSASCGDGVKSCTRTCKNGAWGDAGCPFNQQIKHESCNKQACCSVSESCSNWTQCSVTCGGGTKSCSKSCTNGNWGDACCPVSAKTNYEACNVQQCDVTSTTSYEECSDFGDCSKTCGTGTKYCTRKCKTGQWGDPGCPLEQQYRYESCNAGACCAALQECSNFGACSSSCGGGVRRCSRTCSNGQWGSKCCPTDQQFKLEACNAQTCSARVEGCTRNEELSTCSANCGGGQQECTRRCVNGAWGDPGCPLVQKYRTKSCNTQTCGEGSILNCNNGSSKCSASCGGGTKSCNRTCNNGLWGQAGCPQHMKVQQQSCNDHSCCPAQEDCTNFSACSASCGGGIKTCKRTCKEGGWGGQCCPAELEIKFSTCNVESCQPEVQDCNDFGACSTTCNGGKKMCTRTCLNGNWGDAGCPLSQKEKYESCNNEPCSSGPVVGCDNFSECSASCGGGTRMCTRTCSNGQWGDLGCPADLQYNSVECNMHTCGKCVSDCWRWNADTEQCDIRNDDPTCFTLTCDYNAVNVEFASKLFDITDNQSPSPFTDAQLNPTWDSSRGKWIMDCAFGECGMVVTTDVIDTENYIVFGYELSVEQAAIDVRQLQVYFAPTIMASVKFCCNYKNNVTVSSEMEVYHPKLATTTTTFGSLAQGFGLQLFVDPQMSSVVESNNLFIGQEVFAQIAWSVTKLEKQVGFYINSCDLVFDENGQADAIRIIDDNCYSATFGTTQLQQQKMVANKSEFKFTSFIVGEGAQRMKMQLKCCIKLCVNSDTSCRGNITTTDNECNYTRGYGYKANTYGITNV